MVPPPTGIRAKCARLARSPSDGSVRLVRGSILSLRFRSATRLAGCCLNHLRAERTIFGLLVHQYKSYDCTIVSDTNRGQATLMVGRCWKSHWAMTLSLRDYWIGQGRRKFETDILFDVACRVAEAPEWLGSSYRVLCGQVAVSQQLGQALMPADSPECLITSDKATVKLETSSGPYPIIRYDAPVTSIESLPDTVRWRYAMRLCAEEP